MYIQTLLIVGLALVVLLVLYRVFRSKSEKELTTLGQNKPSDVAEFYNDTTDKFLAVYGEIIQAFRTNDVGSYLDYTAKNMQLGENQRVLDAGCGVCGPAAYFAKNYPSISIDACSISKVQIAKALVKVKEENVQERVNPVQGDYHELASVFSKDSYDRVYFLESYGHSNDKQKLINSVWEVLKPEGKVYIKDLFKREVDNEWEQAYIDKICGEIDTAYKYNIGSLHETISLLRKKGFILRFVKTPEVDIDEFEHLTISNDFQNLFDIGKIESWDEYIFPIDFYEILAEKPKTMTLEEKHLYFMNKQ